ncbi:MAG: NTP transferase domain-containing protein [Alphaproteobacteria bacterium]|nr:NTP transferase domain-containing protein [Alphaproteobacteria bacterium]
MQIVVPMSGFGERFLRAGYKIPKFLIEVEGKPIIAHVIDMFPGEKNFLFICNKDHLAEASFKMRETILKYCPTGKIVGISPHKLGPVHAVLQAGDMIDAAEPVVVNYCDFTCYWDWKRFLKFVEASKCDGAIVAYKGFHPHSLGATNYAYMKEVGGWVSDIQEKKPFTDNKMKEYASSGTYYYTSGKLMLDAFRAVKERDLNVAGEFYVSLSYKPLIEAGRAIAVYGIQHFMQFGTPEDLAEYNYWSETFRKLASPKTDRNTLARGAVVVPMAGLGKRFADEGYTTTKPMIPVSGLPMVVQATLDLPRVGNYVFVIRRDMPEFDEVCLALRKAFPGAVLEFIDKVTEGQACTADIGMRALERERHWKQEDGPVTFGACDSGAVYDASRFAALIDDPGTDVVVWAIRGYANAALYPKMYGWLDVEGDLIKNVSVKVPLSNPANDPIVLGTFTFKKSTDFHRCVDRMISRNARVNNEFYLDTCVNDALALGLRCRVFEVDSYLSWGTPDNLRTFEYWQSCFHKWSGHPYDLKLDARVPREKIDDLVLSFADE